MIREINLCNHVKCIYSDENEVYQAVFYLKDWTEVRIALKCNPEDPAEVFTMKYKADAFFEQIMHWTEYAQEFVCRRFLPYFYHVAGDESRALLDADMLKTTLQLSRITINYEGYFTMSFKPFSIGKRTSVLWAFGTLEEGFKELCDQENIVPEVSGS